MSQTPLIRVLMLLAAILITFSALILAMPAGLPELSVEGTAAVNQAPAVRIKLAKPTPPSAPTPAPVTPEPEPEPKPQPEPEPKPEPPPEPPSKPEPKPKPEPEPEPVPEPERPHEAAIKAPAEVSPAEKENPDQQVELAAGNSAEVDSYLTELSRHLSRFYEYPRRSRRLGQEGSPVIVFEFNRNGKLVNHSLSQSSSHKLLDEAALDMLKAAEPLPQVPDSMTGQTFSYALPVRFSLR